ncbi:hypothetical protein SPB21_31725 [Leptothoe sp. ISB3NOV94-8A]
MGLLSNPNVGSTTAGVYATILKQLETGGQGQFVSSFGPRQITGISFATSLPTELRKRRLNKPSPSFSGNNYQS